MKKKTIEKISSKIGEEEANIIFKIKSNMIKVDYNFGGKDTKCILCGSLEPAKLLFQCRGTKDILSQKCIKIS